MLPLSSPCGVPPPHLSPMHFSHLPIFSSDLRPAHSVSSQGGLEIIENPTKASTETTSESLGKPPIFSGPPVLPRGHSPPCDLENLWDSNDTISAAAFIWHSYGGRGAWWRQDGKAGDPPPRAAGGGRGGRCLSGVQVPSGPPGPTHLQVASFCTPQHSKLLSVIWKGVQLVTSHTIPPAPQKTT